MTTKIQSIPTITPDRTLNEIVAVVPEALGVLQQFGLDTCCGGALTLETAAQRHGLELSQLVAALEGVAKS